MAKLCALLVLALACVVRAVRIDPPSLVRTGKYFASDLVARTTIDDPICRQGNGLYAHPSDCTRYLACSEGSSQERECPEGFKFDTRRHCTPVEDADCGRRQVSYKVAVAAVCPQVYGIFPDPQDCHKFFVCVDGVPREHKCPEGQHYHDNVGCVDGEECPRQAGAAAVCPQDFGIFPDPQDCHKYFVCVEGVPRQHRCPRGQHYQDNVGCVDGEACPRRAEESTVCRKADGLYPHSNCLRFYKCVNFKPQSKGCSQGKAFDPRKETCTREQFNVCKRNDVQDIMRQE